MPPVISEVGYGFEGSEQRKDSVNGGWRSKAVLRAMKGVKRDEMFQNLRKVNESNTITKKLATINAQPNVMNIPKKQDLIGSVSQRLPHMSTNLSNPQLLGSDPMKPPTLKQLRMEAIQRQIIEKTNAGIPIGAIAIDSSNIIMRAQH